MFWNNGMTICRQEADKGGSAPAGDEPATADNTISDDPGKSAEAAKPEDQQTEGKPEEKTVDPDVRAEKEALFQTKYQNLLQLTEQRAPEVAQEFKGESPKTPGIIEDDSTEDTRTLAEMTPAELTVALAKANEASIKKGFDAARSEAQVAQERAYAHNQLRDIQKDLGLDDKAWDEAMKATNQLQIDTEVPGGFGRYGMAMASNLRLASLTTGQTAQAAAIQKQAEDQARTNAQGQQPPKGGVPAQKPKTDQQKALEGMQKVKPRSSRGLLDSTRT